MPTLPRTITAALATLNAMIAAGGEYPDAEFAASTAHKVSATKLRAAYDAQPAKVNPFQYAVALSNARRMMDDCEGLEPTSALKQAGSDAGIPYGDEMGAFVRWAYAQLGIA